MIWIFGPDVQQKITDLQVVSQGVPENYSGFPALSKGAGLWWFMRAQNANPPDQASNANSTFSGSEIT